MSDAASSPAAAKPGSRAALMQQRRAAAELEAKRAALVAKQEAERKALEEEQAALSVVLDSTLERSLRENLVIAHGEVLGELADEKDVIDLIEANKYDEEDLIDAEFWESGVEEPAELDEEIADAITQGKGLSKPQAKQIYATYTKWRAAYLALDTKFIARALLARELKVVFAKKREQVRSHPHCARSASLTLLSAHRFSLPLCRSVVCAVEGCARAGRPVLCFGRGVGKEGRTRHRHGRQDFVQDVRMQAAHQVPAAMWLLQIRSRLQRGMRLRHGWVPQYALVLGLA